MKGRLLKGGEPDLDGVAKVVLSDWVRGRIPYFVPPPDRSEELNLREAKAARGGKGKGKTTAKDSEMVVPGVKQNLGSIMQKNSFVGEDVRPLEVGNEADHARDEEDEEASAGSSSGEDAEDEEAEDEALAWNDVFPESGDDALPKPEKTQADSQGGEVLSSSLVIQSIDTSSQPLRSLMRSLTP